MLLSGKVTPNYSGLSV